MPTGAASPSSVRHVPAQFLLRPEPLAAALLIAFNDFGLKRRAPGVLSGKLSDVGLCFLFPLLVAAALEWARWLAALRPNAAGFAPKRGTYVVSTALAAAYFALLKLFAWGAHLHVAILSTLLPSRHFRAVADPTDLFCLPLVIVAFRFLERSRSRINRQKLL